jgi:CDGSH-type Zn-finger protein
MSADQKPHIKVTQDGPYEVSGNVPLGKEIIETDGEEWPVRWVEGKKYPEKESYSLCRCGHSSDKPFCDGSHRLMDFDGTETAGNQPYAEQAEKTAGPEIELSDVKKFCAGTSFCDRAGGTWELTENSADPKSKELAIGQACNCPSGRLVMHDKKTGQAIEPKHEPSIGIEEAPWRKISGPICVKGGIPVESADGQVYEVRNRMTLCRCGHSKNKPFCDGQHIAVNFNDGDESIKS